MTTRQTSTRARTVLVAGATGMLGREVAALLRAEGYRVRTLSRDPARARVLAGLADEIVLGDATNPDSLVGALDGVAAVVSCLGAPMAFVLRGRRSFHDVDAVANLNLLNAATRAGVERFVYVSLLVRPAWEQTAYVRAHEEVVREVRRAPISSAIVRPTGMFPIFDPFLPMARRGLVYIPGDGCARTNPIHPREVAEVCVAALGEPDGTEIAIGGPEVLSREDIVRLAFEAVGRRPRVLHLPRWALIAFARVLHPWHPRLAEVTDFSACALTNDFLAPEAGSQRLRDHFAGEGRSMAGAASGERT